MAITPWYTSTDLIEAIKRKISFPVSQNTFDEEDLLKFANEEILIAQVPSVLSFHEEYFVTTEDVPLVLQQNRYAIPNRAIGLKLRDIFYKDISGNLFEMTRINSDDRAFFQNNVSANEAIYKFYLEGNDVVLTPKLMDNPSGSLLFVYFLRPNQLVPNDQAAIIQSFQKQLTIDNSTIVAGDTFTIDSTIFTAVAGVPSTNEFQIAGTSILTASNLVNTINANGIVTADNGTPATATITLTFTDRNTTFDSSNTTAIAISDAFLIKCTAAIPSNIQDGSIIDILQTKPGHKTLAMNITLGTNAVSGDTFNFSDDSDIPTNLVTGDYICLENECIIPQIPTDLHPGLAERTCARILASIGDQQGLQSVQAKIQDISVAEGSLLDNRVEGAPQKVTALRSLLRYGKMRSIRKV